MNVGLIGNGFVGNAIYHNLKDNNDFLIYDKDPSRSTAAHIREVCHGTKIIFVALPTPMYPDGRCDLSIILNAMAQIACWYNDNIVILKSTVPPGTCDQIQKIHEKIRMVFSPEFLTEKNSIEDFKNCNRVIFGGDEKDVLLCEELFKKSFPDKDYLRTDATTAEVVKYFLNTFLATKVSFANEMYDMCEAVGVSYDHMLEMALYDKRLTKTHFLVPGPDGDRGFGGTCFPKDLNALISFCERKDIDCQVLSAVWDKNLKVRNNLDWLEKIGRSISNNKEK